MYRNMRDIDVCTEFELLKFKVPIIFLGTEGFSPLRRDVNVPDYRRLIPRSMSADLLGRGTIITSWACFPLYEYEWGSAFGVSVRGSGRPEEGCSMGYRLCFQCYRRD